MRWFEHRYRWIAKISLSPIVDPQSKITVGTYILEDCGAERAIEYHGGQTPNVRVALPEKEWA